MTCPTCGLENPESAQRCDCGLYFDRRMGGRPAPVWQRYAFPMLLVGTVLATLFLILFLWYHAPR